MAIFVRRSEGFCRLVNSISDPIVHQITEDFLSFHYTMLDELLFLISVCSVCVRVRFFF